MNRKKYELNAAEYIMIAVFAGLLSAIFLELWNHLKSPTVIVDLFGNGWFATHIRASLPNLSLPKLLVFIPLFILIFIVILIVTAQTKRTFPLFRAWMYSLYGSLSMDSFLRPRHGGFWVKVWRGIWPAVKDFAKWVTRPLLVVWRFLHSVLFRKFFSYNILLITKYDTSVDGITPQDASLYENWLNEGFWKPARVDCKHINEISNQNNRHNKRYHAVIIDNINVLHHKTDETDRGDDWFSSIGPRSKWEPILEQYVKDGGGLLCIHDTVQPYLYDLRVCYSYLCFNLSDTKNSSFFCPNKRSGGFGRFNETEKNKCIPHPIIFYNPEKPLGSSKISELLGVEPACLLSPSGGTFFIAPQQLYIEVTDNTLAPNRFLYNFSIEDEVLPINVNPFVIPFLTTTPRDIKPGVSDRLINREFIISGGRDFCSEGKLTGEKSERKGRTAFTVLGHKKETYSNPKFQKHFLQLLYWVADKSGAQGVELRFEQKSDNETK